MAFLFVLSGGIEVPNYNYPLYPSVTFNPAKDKVYSLTTDFDLAPGAETNVLLIIPDDFVRLVDQKLYFLNGELEFKVLEGANVTDNGTPAPSGNIDLNYNMPSVVNSFKGSTYTGGFMRPGMPHFGIANDISNFEVSPPQTVSAVTLKRLSNYIYNFKNVSDETIENIQFVLVWLE